MKLEELARTASLLAVWGMMNASGQAAAQDTAFTYQGQLMSAGSQANGSYDLTFTLFATSSGGAAAAGPLTNLAVAVANGQFSLTLDFGASVWNGSAYWLEVGARTNGATSFSVLSPRQPVLPAPCAIYAATAGSATTANTFSGTLGGDVTGTQGATVVSSVGGQSAANVATGVAAANGATSANLPGAIVLRDNSGNFSAGTITATLNGNATTATTAANVTGNIPDCQLSSNIAMLANTNIFAGTMVATNTNNVFAGNGAGLTALNPAGLSAGIAGIDISGNAATATTATSAATAGSAVTAISFSGGLSGDVSGTQGATLVGQVGGQSSIAVATAVLAVEAATSAGTPGAIVQRDTSGNFSAGAITATAFSGGASALTGLNASQLTSGTVADSVLSANVPLLSTVNTFAQTNIFQGTMVATNTNNVFAGNGAGLTALNPAGLRAGIAGIDISGNAATATTATSAATAGCATTAAGFSGALSGDVSGTQGATVVGQIGGQSSIAVADAVLAVEAATSAGTPGAIVQRDTSGNFSAGAITATAFSGGGSALTGLNASQLASGTVADSVLSDNVPLLSTVNTFAQTNIFQGAIIATNPGNLIAVDFTMPTNAPAGLTLSAAMAYATNLTANITLNSFSAVPSNRFWSTYLLCTNSAPSTNYTITFPPGCVGAGNGKPPVYYVTNGTLVEFQVSGWGTFATNVNWSAHY